MIEDKTYSVQFVVIREIVVETHDDLAAEREAFAKLSERDKRSAIALRVFSHGEDCSGALDGDLSKAWRFARENFDTIDLGWVDPDHDS